MERQLGRVRNSFAPKRGVKDLTSILFNIHSKTFHSISELGSRAVKERNYPQGAHIILGERWKCKPVTDAGREIY